MLGRIVNFFVGVVTGHEHMHIDIGIVVEAQITLNTIGIGVFVEAMTDSALPLLCQLFFVLLFVFYMLLGVLLTVLSPVSF